MKLLYLSMPGGAEWIIILLVIIGIPVFLYRLGYSIGKKAGKLEAYKEFHDQQKTA
ncbi:MAG: hypothetical protein QM731_12215 [Chitinophagaceae bacterium]